MFRLTVLLLLVASLANAATPATWREDDVGRIVALSDVHGAYDAMVRTLENAGVIDGDGAWVGDSTRLVIVGDLLDRGPDSRDAMDLLMRLEGEAAAAGGRVHVLIGNHEAMNLVGDLRYVSAGEYAAFAEEETAEERERVFTAWAARNPDGDAESLRPKFDESFPRGYFAHRRAFRADGVYGKWLLSKPVIVVLNRTAFVHGGLSPLTGKYGLEGVNRTLVGELTAYMEAVGVLEDAGLLLPTDSDREHLAVAESSAATPGLAPAAADAIARLPALAASDLHAPDGPLWYRGNVFCGELIEQDRLAAALAALDADRVVIGHTPTPNHEVLGRIDDLVYEVDTGMLHDYYGGSGHALVIEGSAYRVVAEASRESLAPEPHPRRTGVQPDTLATPEDLERLLRLGELGAPAEDAAGRLTVSVSNGALTVNAAFEPRASRGNYPAVAAYRLDRLLELDMVPVTVVREVDGEDGSLQYLPPDTLDEDQRAAAGQGGGAYCPLNDQLGAMYVFDALVYNAGRSRQNILYSTDTWQLLLVGNGNTFGRGKGRPPYLEKAPITIGAAWREALSALDEQGLEAVLGDVLDKRRRRVLLERRDELLAAP
jgi:hypothetical protein